jgi:site-specific DNA-adenine methylase
MFFDLFNKPVLPKSLQLRIPYMGSKRKIAEQLMQKMLEIKPKAKYFYDLFAGGGAMSFYALQCGLKVHHNEKQKGMVDLLEYILNRTRNKEKGQYGLFPDDFYNFITREEFFKLKDEYSIKGQFARIIYSFGNSQTNYLFGKDIEYQKQLGHNIVMFCCEKSLKELNLLLNTNIKISNAKTWSERRLDYLQYFPKEQRKIKKLKRLQQLERLEQSERLEQLQELQRLPTFTISNLDFADVKITTPVDETIIYLDPPYRNTAEYKEKFNYEKVDEFFKNSPYTCFMSEYNAPFNSILEIRKESLLNNKNSLKEKKFIIEKLFWNEK